MTVAKAKAHRPRLHQSNLSQVNHHSVVVSVGFFTVMQSLTVQTFITGDCICMCNQKCLNNAHKGEEDKGGSSKEGGSKKKEEEGGKKKKGHGRHQGPHAKEGRHDNGKSHAQQMRSLSRAGYSSGQKSRFVFLELNVNVIK